MLTPAAAHQRLEAIVAEALASPDPAAALRKASKDRSLPAELRRALAAAQGDGVRMAALLVARLRFERLLRGSAEAEAWFDADPEGFAATFRRYHAEVPPSAFYPQVEARLFQRWIASSAAAEPLVAMEPQGRGSMATSRARPRARAKR